MSAGVMDHEVVVGTPFYLSVHDKYGVFFLPAILVVEEIGARYRSDEYIRQIDGTWLQGFADRFFFDNRHFRAEPFIPRTVFYHTGEVAFLSQGQPPLSECTPKSVCTGVSNGEAPAYSELCAWIKSGSMVLSI